MYLGMGDVYFAEANEVLLRQWWRRNRLRGRRAFESHGEAGEAHTPRLEITMKPPLPDWIVKFAGPPVRRGNAAS